MHVHISKYTILKRTLKSFTWKEELYLIFLLCIALISGYFSYKNLMWYSNQYLSWQSSDIEIYTEGVIGDIKWLNPVYVDLNQVDRDISAFIFSGLTKYNPKTKKFDNDVATHTLSKDKKTYRFVLQNNIFWHDNTPLTADDIYFTYHDVIQHPDFQNPILKANFEKIKLVKIDQKTVEFTLDQPNSYFYGNTTVGILPKHLLQDVPVADLIKHTFNKTPVGSGPYKIDTDATVLTEDNVQVSLTRFDKYYGNKNKIKNIRFTTFSDVDMLLKSRKILDGSSRLSNDQHLQVFREDKRFSLYKYSLFRYTAAFFNLKSTILSDKRVRMALFKSINKDELLERLSHKRRIDTPFLQLNQEDWILQPNINEAKGALFDAGWKFADPSDIFRSNNQKKSLTLRLIARNFQDNLEKKDEYETVINFLTAKWKSIGIDVAVELLDESSLIDRILKKDYDILLQGHDLGYNFDVYTYWHSSSIGQNGLNFSNFTSVKADNLIESLRNLFDREDDKKIRLKLQQLQKEIQNEVPALFLYSPYYFYAVRNDLTNISLEGLVYHSDRFFGMPEWEAGSGG